MSRQGMLVLTRTLDEEVVIGDEEIVVKIIRITGDKVRLGFSAPKGVMVNRREVYEDLKRVQRRAAAS